MNYSGIWSPFLGSLLKGRSTHLSICGTTEIWGSSGFSLNSIPDSYPQKSFVCSSRKGAGKQPACRNSKDKWYRTEMCAKNTRSNKDSSASRIDSVWPLFWTCSEL